MDAGAIDDLEGKPLSPHSSTNPELLAAYLEGDTPVSLQYRRRLGCGGCILKTRATEELEYKQKIDVFSIALLATIYLLTHLK